MRWDHAWVARGAHDDDLAVGPDGHIRRVIPPTEVHCDQAVWPVLDVEVGVRRAIGQKTSRGKVKIRKRMGRAARGRGYQDAPHHDNPLGVVDGHARRCGRVEAEIRDPRTPS